MVPRCLSVYYGFCSAQLLPSGCLSSDVFSSALAWNKPKFTGKEPTGVMLLRQRPHPRRNSTSSHHIEYLQVYGRTYLSTGNSIQYTTRITFRRGRHKHQWGQGFGTIGRQTDGKIPRPFLGDTTCLTLSLFFCFAKASGKYSIYSYYMDAEKHCMIFEARFQTLASSGS